MPGTSPKRYSIVRMPDCQTVVTCSFDCTLLFWDPATGARFASVSSPTRTPAIPSYNPMHKRISHPERTRRIVSTISRRQRAGRPSWLSTGQFHSPVTGSKNTVNG